MLILVYTGFLAGEIKIHVKKTELSLTFVLEYSEVVLLRAGPSFQYFVTDFQKIREIARYIHIYGCYSRNDYPHQKNISRRKYDDELRRFRDFVGDHNLDEHQVGREKVVSTLTRPGYSLENYLAELYYARSLTATEISLYVLIPLLIQQAGALSVTELMTRLDLLGVSLESLSRATVSRQADALVKEGLLVRGGTENQFVYSVPVSILDALSTEELEQLYVAVSFFCHIIFPSIPGEFLKNTMERYFESRQLSPYRLPLSMTFPYFHHVLDDQLVWTLLEAMDRSRAVTFRYGRDQCASQNVTLEPVRVMLDLTYSRWYLVGKQAGDRYLRTYRLDRITGLKVAEETFDMQILEEQYFQEYETSWLSVGRREKPPVTVELLFRQRGESEHPFVLRRVQRQARGGVVTELTDKEFLYTVTVNDPVELLPWIRSFNHHVEVLPSQEHDLRERWASERRRMLANYGVICEE